VFYSIAHPVVRFFLRLLFRFQASGLENVPAGGAIIAPNHISNLDPPVIGCALPTRRRIHFMAKEELFKNPVVRWVITQLCAFPVRRGTADRGAIRSTLSLLAAGELVGIFPEGTRSKTGQLGKPEAGLAMIAAKAGVPVVPTAIFGTAKVFKGGHILPPIRVVFGQPLTINPGPNDKEALEEFNAAVMREIARLLAAEGS
jgi:1-acyl-sn-glycerol-3-phosphate acyltransferase